jgi:choline dehydrogenase-like flavoprotein
VDERYDVVIVGAGIAGAIVAKRLVKAKKRVLMLEAGRGIHLEGEAAYRDYRKFVERYYANSIKVPNAPYPPNPNAPSQDCIQAASPQWQFPGSGYFVQNGKLPFGSDFFRGQGGTTLHWTGTALRMLPNDFKLSSKYGHGVNWPFGYEDLRPWYEEAEFEIGVSANVADQVLPNMGKHFYGDEGYDYPMEKMPQSYLDRTLRASIDGVPVEDHGEAYHLSVISTPMGRNSVPRAGYKPVGSIWDPTIGVRCEGNASCVPICPVQAKFNALKTLAAAAELAREQKGQFTIQTQSVATKIDIDPDSGRVTGITYQRYADPNSPEHTVHTAKAKIYVIAAHSVETAKLLLASGAARRSGQVGKNLMDHSCMLVWALMPERVGAFRGPTATSNIPTFRDGNFRSQHAAFIAPVYNWGWLWAALAPGSTLTQMLRTDLDGNGPPPPPHKSWIPKEPLIGSRLRGRVGETVSRQLAFDFEFEQLPEAKNCVSIDPTYKDALGNYRPVVTWDIPEYTKAAMPVASRVWKSMLAKLGIPEQDDGTTYQKTDPTYVEYEGKGYSFAGAGHLVGTHRMGIKADDSVVDPRQRTWEHDNLYLVGCGNFPTLGTSNPTLTMSALACWAAKNILEDLGKR